MNREILFRGKRVDNGEWVYGYYCEAEMLDHSGTEYFIVEHACDGSQYQIDPQTRGRYTGLTDKNGKKIFEGDILCVDEPEDPSAFGEEYFPVFGVVQFGTYNTEICMGNVCAENVGFFVAWQDNEDDDYSETYRQDLGYWKKHPYCEIRGNIHDNPELMGGKTMNNEEKKCYFVNPSPIGTYSCRRLYVKECDGFNTSCSFFKTEDKFNSDRDEAIDRCREKGICHGCKYSKIPCIKANEC